MGDGQEVPESFPRKMNAVIEHFNEEKERIIQERSGSTQEQHTTIILTLCWGCGAMIEDVIIGEAGWLFCPCGTGIMKVTI